MQQDKNYRFAPGVYPVNGGQPRCSECGNNLIQPRIPRQARNESGNGNSGGMALAMAYVRSQPFENLYSPEEAWHRGTLFMDLDLPYGGGRF